jgi:hypothetical protein
MTINTSNRLIETLTDFPQSVFLGKPGKFTYFGIEMTFNESKQLYPSGSLWVDIQNVYARNYKVSTNILFQRHLYVLVHEMGHALAAKSLIRVNPRIEIDNPPDQGLCRTYEPEVTRWEIIGNIINAAGPIAGAAFAACQMIGAAFVACKMAGANEKKKLPFMLIFGTGSLLQMFLDLCYMIESSLRLDDGDWGKLAKSNTSHFCLAAFMMMSLYAISLFTAYKKIGKSLGVAPGHLNRILNKFRSF